MPPRKNVIFSASPSQEKASQQSADKASAAKNRRRDIYKQVSVDKKQMLLLQRRTRRQESNNQNLLTEYISPLSSTQLRLTGQKGITIRELPCQPQAGSTSRDDLSGAVQGKGKNVISSLCIFEQGSTLAAPAEQHKVKSRPIASTTSP